ncbi:MAG TPA: alpha-L-fucosidase [Phycisphaerae bacterium]|nr:alpha-L-fucosidase [Phycisphaerae bacterium]
MELSRRTTLKLLAATLLPTTLSRTLHAADTTTQPFERPLPPAPTPIPAPPNFGIAPGPFQPNADSLSNWSCPDWYRDAKLGLWAHWGPQCQPEQGDWYAKGMYQYNSWQYKSHCEHYGHPSKFGFKDVINTWKAENWDPDHLVSLYKKAGAKFFAAMANHHDNFDMFDSTYQPWNSTRIGPKTDIIGRWEKAARNAGLRFALTSHGDRSWSWMQESQGADPSGPYAHVQYDGRISMAEGTGQWWEGFDPQDLYAQYHTVGKYDWPQNGKPPIDPNFITKFYNRTIDLISKYNPDLLYFDDTILPLYPASDIGFKIAAFLYNTNAARNGGTCQALITGKLLQPEHRKFLLLDVERGVTAGADPLPWQTDTCIGSWHYDRGIFDRHQYKSATQVIQMLIDIVSKNGTLLLNIPLKGDGTPDADELKVVDALAQWIAPNGDAIYATRPWSTYGEGPSTTASQPKGQFGGARDVRNYTPEDFRFTMKGETLYAFLMAWPDSGTASIKSLAANSPHFPKPIARIELLGAGPVQFTRTPDALQIQLPPEKPNPHAYALKITPA